MEQKTFTITNPLTGKALEKTPDGINLQGITFKSQEEAEKFIFEHWPRAVLMEECKSIER